MKFLITGASGIIGRYLLGDFQSAGHQVVGVYRNNEPTIARDWDDSQVDWIKVDLTDNLADLESVEVVVHAAGHTNLIPDSTPNDFIQSNVMTTLNLADYAKSTGVRLFVYLSTMSMYGSITGIEVDEEMPLNDPGMYGLSKYIGETILREYAEFFPSICIRLPGVVGPGYFKPWIGSVLQKALINEPISIYNPNSPFNNVVHLSDLARFILGVVESNNSGYKNVNLAADSPMSIRDVVNLIIDLTESKSKVIEKGITGHSFVIKQEKIKEIFSFMPSTTESTIRHYVEENTSD